MVQRLGDNQRVNDIGGSRRSEKNTSLTCKRGRRRRYELDRFEHTVERCIARATTKCLSKDDTGNNDRDLSLSGA